jgi:hypothetical protein
MFGQSQIGLGVQQNLDKDQKWPISGFGSKILRAMVKFRKFFGERPI